MKISKILLWGLKIFQKSSLPKGFFCMKKQNTTQNSGRHGVKMANTAAVNSLNFRNHSQTIEAKKQRFYIWIEVWSFLCDTLHHIYKHSRRKECKWLEMVGKISHNLWYRFLKVMLQSTIFMSFSELRQVFKYSQKNRD